MSSLLFQTGRSTYSYYYSYYYYSYYYYSYLRIVTYCCGKEKKRKKEKAEEKRKKEEKRKRGNIRGSRGNSKFKRASYSLLDRNRLLRGKRNTHVIVIKGYILLSLLLSLSLFYASTDEEEEEEEEEGIERNT